MHGHDLVDTCQLRGLNLDEFGNSGHRAFEPNLPLKVSKPGKLADPGRVFDLGL